MAWLINGLPWLLFTLVAFFFAEAIYRRAAYSPILHPVVVACALIIPPLLWLNVSYASYRSGALPLLWLLGPATIALAVPLADRLAQLRKMWRPVCISVVAGSVVAMATAVLLGWLLGLDELTLRTLIGKSVTTPIAMGVAEQVGGAPELAATIVIVVGVMGAAVAVRLLDVFGITSLPARGIAIGLSAHGVGTARAAQINPEMAAYAGLAMGLTGLVTAAIAAVIALIL